MRRLKMEELEECLLKVGDDSDDADESEKAGEEESENEVFLSNKCSREFNTTSKLFIVSCVTEKKGEPDARVEFRYEWDTVKQINRRMIIVGRQHMMMKKTTDAKTR